MDNLIHWFLVVQTYQFFGWINYYYYLPFKFYIYKFVKMCFFHRSSLVKGFMLQLFLERNEIFQGRLVYFYWILFIIYSLFIFSPILIHIISLLIIIILLEFSMSFWHNWGFISIMTQIILSFNSGIDCRLFL